MRLLIIMALLLSTAAPARAEFAEKHPRIYKLMAPARAVWRGVVWIDKKTEPLDPLFKVASRVGALSSCAVPFLFLSH